MEIRKCHGCGELFAYTLIPICEKCRKKENELFEVLKIYLKENPSSSLTKMSNDTEISMDKILRYVREGRLVLTNNMSGEIKCERCKVNILTGRFCEDCINKLKVAFIGQEPIEVSGKMHSTFRKK